MSPGYFPTENSTNPTYLDDPMKRKKTDARTQLKIGDISNISGSVTIAGGDISVQPSIPKELEQALRDALTQTKKRRRTTSLKKEKIEKEVKQVQSELGKEKADKGFLEERFRNLAKMAPDILDVILAGIGNPAAGIGLAVKKIAQKAKMEVENGSGNP